jgi:quercetin dioxygenase-like cupin family protein
MITIGKSRDVEPVSYDDGETARNARKRVLLGPSQGAPHFVVRRFTIGVAGHSPYHTHPWEHGVYVLAGRGEVRFAGGATSVEPGDFACVPAMDEHQFANTGDEPFEFLCVVPPEGDT